MEKQGEFQVLSSEKNIGFIFPFFISCVDSNILKEGRENRVLWLFAVINYFRASVVVSEC